jgi:two-component response regulator (ARR-A family)
MGMATESQFHVLAVDDSLIDRKLIEKLLKTSSYQGWPNIPNSFTRILCNSSIFHGSLFLGSSFAFILIGFGCFSYNFFSFFMPVTTVDSGTKALEFLGLHEDDQSNPNTSSVFPNNHQV